ncbi:MAG: DUF2851 family protein [Rikenellaceae bacterium]
MSPQYKISLLELLWQYKHDFFVNMPTTNSSIVSIKEFGSEACDKISASYDGVVIEENGVIKKGSIKFFDSKENFRKWKEQNPISYRYIILAICCDNKIINEKYGDFSIAIVDIPDKLNKLYLSLIYSQYSCAQILASFDSFKLESILTRLVIERLEQKEEGLKRIYNTFEEDENELLLHTIFDTMLIGTKNREPMGELFKTINGSSILRLLQAESHYEALLLGASGLLDEIPLLDEYLCSLRRVYREIASRYSISTMNPRRWAHSSSTPRQTIWVMLSHLASFLFHHQNLLFKVIEIDDYSKMLELFNVPLCNYWQEHNYPSKIYPANSKINSLPKVRRSGIVVNGIVPFLFFYKREVAKVDFSETADLVLDLLFKAEKESNGLINKWTGEGVSNRNAFDSQALIQLTKCYCKMEACAKCPIGISRLLKALD